MENETVVAVSKRNPVDGIAGLVLLVLLVLFFMFLGWMTGVFRLLSRVPGLAPMLALAGVSTCMLMALHLVGIALNSRVCKIRGDYLVVIKGPVPWTRIRSCEKSAITGFFVDSYRGFSGMNGRGSVNIRRVFARLKDDRTFMVFDDGGSEDETMTLIDSLNKAFGF